jgi:hypothetical protein
MARIRSIHPALFTDEAFAGLSMAARVLLFGVWTEADDQGVFDWRPVTLKMRLMPVDNVDVATLLDELSAANVVRKFEEDGRSMGAIRNFCKFQRPKTPKYRPLKSAEVRKYVASSYQNSETVVGHPEPFLQKVEIDIAEIETLPQNGEMSPQRKEEGGKREEIKEKHFVAKAPIGSRDFEELKKSYPRRAGNYGWAAAEKKFNSLVKTGVDPKAIIAAAAKLCQTLRSRIGTEFIPMPASWLNSEDFTEIAANAFETEQTDWDAICKYYKSSGNWSRHGGPEPGENGCRVPRDKLEKYDLLPADPPFDVRVPSPHSMQQEAS